MAGRPGESSIHAPGSRTGSLVGPLTNYRITDADKLGQRGANTKSKDNIAAIRELRDLEGSGLPPTPKQKAKLVKYVGWGDYLKHSRARMALSPRGGKLELLNYRTVKRGTA